MRSKPFSQSALRIGFSGFAALVFLSGCGGNNSGSNSNPPPSISVSVSPTTASLSGSGVQSFTAAVFNDSSNAGVTWSIGAGAGALSASTVTGVTYTAPSTIGATTTVTLTATSKTDITKTASAAITLNPTAAPPTITSVAASCVPASVQTGQTSQCAAAVTGTGAYSSTVTWSVSGVAGGNSTVGTISTAGLYSAPSAVPSTNPVSVIATSTEDTTKSGSAAITIGPALVSIQVTPAYPSVAAGGTQQFTATGTFSDSSTQNLTSTVNWTSSSTAAATIGGSGLATALVGGTTTIQAASGTLSGSTSLIVTASTGTVSPAAGVTDANGLATLVSNGLTLPVQLTDQDTGTPLAGTAVALGTDPSVPGSAILLVADPTGVHPLQMMLLEGSLTTAAAASHVRLVATRKAKLSAAWAVEASGTSSPAAVAASTGCPAGSGTTASQAISLKNLTVPPMPVSTAGVQTQTVDAINALLTLNPKNIPAGVYGPISVAQYPVTSQCVQDIINIGKEHLTAKNISLFILSKTVIPEPVTQVMDIVDAAGLVLLSPKALTAANECWYSPSVSPLNNPVLNITSTCFGGACILIPQLQLSPEAPSNQQLGQDYSMQATVVQPAKESVETYIQSGDLGGIVVGTTDSTGNGAVEVPLGDNTVCVDAAGYQQFTQPGFIVSAPGTPLNVTLTPQEGAQSYTGSYSAPFSGTALDPNGGVYSAAADFAFTLNLTQGSDGSITGTASVPADINISVVSCPSSTTCSANSFTDTATGSVTGTNGNITGSLSSAGTDPLTITLTGVISGNSIALTGSFGITLVGTGSDGPPISNPLSGTITGLTLEQQ